jgi:hypothetical protein
LISIDEITNIDGRAAMWAIGLPVALLVLIPVLAICVPTMYIRKSNKMINLWDEARSSRANEVFCGYQLGAFATAGDLRSWKRGST